MVDIETYIKDGLRIVKRLVDEGNLQSALRACQELLKVNPYHRKIQKYLRNIEELILRENSEKVDADLKATAHLWKEGRFEDLMKIYTRLYQYAPQHTRLRKLIEKLNAQLTAQQRDERRLLVEKAFQAIHGLLDEKRYADAIQACHELQTIDPLNPKIVDTLKAAKTGLIDEKLKTNESLVDSPDFERALEFYEQLLAIDPNHEKVRRLATDAKEYLTHQKALADKILLNEAISRMKGLFKNAEYEKVLQACEEIDRMDPGNFSARFFQKKAERTMYREANILIVKKLKETWASLASEYAKNPAAFVKV